MDIKAIQAKARQAMGGKMNIIERTALWYRLERIGAEPRVEPTIIYEDIEWSNRQWDAVNQLKAKVLYLQKNVNTLKEIKTLPPPYVYIGIKEEDDSHSKSEAKGE